MNKIYQIKEQLWNQIRDKISKISPKIPDPNWCLYFDETYSKIYDSIYN